MPDTRKRRRWLLLAFSVSGVVGAAVVALSSPEPVGLAGVVGAFLVCFVGAAGLYAAVLSIVRAAVDDTEP